MRRTLQGALLLLASISTIASGQGSARSAIDSATLASQPEWYPIYFRSFDAAAAALDLQPLRDTRLARGEREVRVWTQIEIGEPKRMTRLRDVNRRVTGEGTYYWRGERPDTNRGSATGRSVSDIVAHDLTGTCGPIAARGGTAACRARFVRPPDWSAILREAEGAGLWTIPDPSSLPSDGIITIDGWTIVVELRTSDSYRAYRYNSPESHPSWPSAAQAIRIAETFAGPDALLARPDAEQRYRGVTRGEYGSAIRLCGGKETWQFGDALSNVAALQGIALPDSTGKTEPEYYVEVTGIASPEWAARSPESKFARALRPARLHVVKLWTGAECAM